VAALTDSLGNVNASYSYEPFGKLKSSSGTVTNPYRWLGGLGVYYTPPGLTRDGYPILRSRARPGSLRWIQSPAVSRTHTTMRTAIQSTKPTKGNQPAPIIIRSIPFIILVAAKSLRIAVRNISKAQWAACLHAATQVDNSIPTWMPQQQSLRRSPVIIEEYIDAIRSRR